MKRNSKKLALHKETLRALSFPLLAPVVGGATTVSACFSAAWGNCTTWGNSDCGDCGSANPSNCGCSHFTCVSYGCQMSYDIRCAE